MQVRLSPHVICRAEPFGGTVYVHDRNDFFFLDDSSFRFVSQLKPQWVPATTDHGSRYRELASLGICDTRNPAFKEKCYRGSAFIGEFQDIPKVAKPLVINCFTTAHCPLLCRYCHADDLMKPFRDTETEEHLENVIRTVRRLDSLVAVITGGDPLTKVDRAIRLIQGIGGSKSLVLDTSGVPNTREDVKKLIPTLIANN